MRVFDSTVTVLGLLLVLSGAARAAVLNFVGDSGGDWDAPYNWSPAQVPTAADDVLIAGKWVRTTGSVSAGSLTVSGSAGLLTVGGTTDKPDAQTGADPDSSDRVRLHVARDLLLADGARISVGGRRQTRGIAVSVDGDLTLSGGARAYFYAGGTDGLNVTRPAASFARLYANANVVAVGGTLTVGASSALYPENEGLAGTPVFFRPGEFVLEEGATVSTAGRGWGFFKVSGSYPVGAFKAGDYYCYSPGAGSSYQVGGGYGANSGNIAEGGKTTFSHGVVISPDGETETASLTHGQTYGYACAPFLPGSPNGTHSTPVRGAGSFCVFAERRATVAGTVDARGANTYYGAPSGGGIWIAAPELFVARSAVLTAEGATVTGNYSSSGGGGRIALSVGVPQAGLDRLAAGDLPEDLALATAPLYGCDFNVLGGFKTNGGGGRSAAGSATVTFTPQTSLVMDIRCEATEDLSAEPAFGLHGLAKASLPAITLTEGYPGFYRGFRRFTPQGRRVTTPSGPIPDSGIATATEPLTLAWEVAAEDALRLRTAGGGQILVDGQPTDGIVWRKSGEKAVVAATDAAGAFVGWQGDLPGGCASDREITVAVKPGQVVWCVFSDAAAAAKTFVGDPGGFWDEDANWSPAGIPAPTDDVTIPSGAFVRRYGVAVAKSLSLASSFCALGGRTEPKMTTNTGTSPNTLKSSQTPPDDAYALDAGLRVDGPLTMTGSGALSLGAPRQATSLACLTVGGDVTLANTSVLIVHADAYDESVDGGLDANGHIPLTNYYRSAFAVSIGGRLDLADSAAIYPDCDPLTGNPVRFDVGGDVTIAAKAKVDANLRGWALLETVAEGGTADPRSYVTGTYFALAPGYGSSCYTGAGYGGGGATAPRRAYGFPYAPYLPGSCSGAYSGHTRGGGTIWIRAHGQMSVAGTLTANGAKTTSTSSGSAGGGIWLVAEKFRAADTAKITANGGNGFTDRNQPTTANSGGCGGRVSVAVGLKDRDLDRLADGQLPLTCGYEDELPLVAATADGGMGLEKAPDGTLTTVSRHNGFMILIR